MAIQNRRGVYIDFDPSKLVEGEWAVVQSGDPNSSRGRAVYMAFETGVVERMATYEDMEENIDSATSSIQQAFTAELQQTIADANTTVDGLESDIADAISDANTAVSVMQTSVNTAITDANTRITAIETDYADLKTDNADELSSMHTQVNDAVYDTGVAITNAENATRNANQIAQQIRDLIDQGGFVVSIFGRSGQVIAQQGDYTSAQITHGAGTVSDALTFDTTPISGSTRAITSGAVYSTQYRMAVSSNDSTAPTSGVEFTSADIELSPTTSESVELLNDSDIWSARLYKISQMFKNIRYLLKMVGTLTDNLTSHAINSSNPDYYSPYITVPEGIKVDGCAIWRNKYVLSMRVILSKTSGAVFATGRTETNPIVTINTDYRPRLPLTFTIVTNNTVNGVMSNYADAYIAQSGNVIVDIPSTNTTAKQLQVSCTYLRDV